MFDVSNVIIMLLCVYYQEGKKLGDIVEIMGTRFRLVVSEEPLEDIPGVLQFRVDPVSTIFKYYEGLKKDEEV